MKKIIIIVGPTGSGKTNLSLEISKRISSEIISADSMQIYKEMNIGTAKVEDNILSTVKHHLINIVTPNEEFSVADFQKEAFNSIEDIISKGKTPIIVGGTGLYINSIIYKLNFSNAKPNIEIRNKLWNDYENNGQDYILELLKSIDMESYKEIDHNNIKRIIRAIEIYEITGEKYSNQNKDFRKKNDDYDFYIYGLNDNRQNLYHRINLRVDKMVEDGLFTEVEYLMKKYDINSQAFKAIGYKEIIAYFNGEYDRNTAIYKLKQNSRKYAKRQLTWFKKDNRIKWFNLEENNDFSNLAEIIYKDVVDG